MVFEHLITMWWMGTSIHTHTITIRRLFPDLRDLAETLVNVSVPTMQLLHYGWGCRKFLAASQVLHSVTYIRCLITFSCGGRAYGCTHTIVITSLFPDLRELLAETLIDVSMPTMSLYNGWGCRTFQTASYIIHIIYKVFEHLLADGCTLTPLSSQSFS